MSNVDYYGRITTKGENLKERIKKACYHYRGPCVHRHFNLNTRKHEFDNEIGECDFIDLAVLLGYRETRYLLEGDKPLTKEEAYKFMEQIGAFESGLYAFYETNEEKAEHIDEWATRVRRGKMKENDDGSIEVESAWLKPWLELSKQFPDETLHAETWESWYSDDGDGWYEDTETCVIKNGSKENVKHYYEDSAHGDDYDWNFDKKGEKE